MEPSCSDPPLRDPSSSSHGHSPSPTSPTSAFDALGIERTNKKREKGRSKQAKHLNTARVNWDAEDNHATNAANSPSAASTSSSPDTERSSASASKNHQVRESLRAMMYKKSDGTRMVNEYNLVRKLGHGTFASVYLGQNMVRKKSYALKEFSKAQLRKVNQLNLRNPRRCLPVRTRGDSASERPEKAAIDEGVSNLELVNFEVAIMKQIRHPNLCRVYEVIDVTSENSIFIVMELCPGGAIATPSNDNEQGMWDVQIPPSLRTGDVYQDVRTVFRQIVQGIGYLHGHDIVHRDIKASNIMYGHDDGVRICDFGVSAAFNNANDDLVFNSAGSPAFMAPELSTANSSRAVHGKPTDIWSLGCLLYLLTYLRLPFIAHDIVQLYDKVASSEPDYMHMPRHDRPVPPESLVALIKAMLRKDQLQRVTILDIWTDPWLTDNGRDPLLPFHINLFEPLDDPDEIETASAITAFHATSLASVFARNLRARVHRRKGGSSAGSPAESDGSVSPALNVKTSETRSDDRSGCASMLPLQVSEGSDALAVSPIQVSEGSDALAVSPIQVPEGSDALAVSPIQVPEDSDALAVSPIQVPEDSDNLAVSPMQVPEDSDNLVASPSDASVQLAMSPVDDGMGDT